MRNCQIKKDDTDGECSAHGRDEKLTHNSDGKHEWKMQLGRSRRRWEDDNRTNVKEIEYELGPFPKT
jgi:hypothetical protein